MLSFFNKWSFTLSNLSFFLRKLSSPYVIAVFKKVLGTINFVRRVQFFAAELIQFWYRLLSTHFFMSEEQNFKFCNFSLLNSYNLNVVFFIAEFIHFFCGSPWLPYGYFARRVRQAAATKRVEHLLLDLVRRVRVADEHVRATGACYRPLDGVTHHLMRGQV